MKKLVIIGASGHGKVVADIAVKNGYDSIVFLDDDPGAKECAGFPVVGGSGSVPDGDVFVAIGNSSIRKRIMEHNAGRVFPALIHPNAVIADGVKIGEGSVVAAGAVVNPGASVGKGCIINTSSSVDHDCVIGEYCHISVGSHLSGTVTVGNGTWFGVGVSVVNNVTICGNCIFGAGAVVISDITEPGTYVGVPVKKVK